MKKSILLITALALSSVSFAQKKELKDVKKAIDRNNLTEAEQLLEKSKDLAFSSNTYFYISCISKIDDMRL